MERLRELLKNDGLIFLIMGILAVMKDMVSTDTAINWRKALSKLFIKIVAGVGFYSFLLSYKPWYGEYPQKIGVIMVAVYMGDKIIDIFVEKGFAWLKKFDIKTFIKKMLEL